MGLILVRHTRPKVAAGLCYGQTDLELAGTFANDAAAVLAALPAINRVASSPLQRCRALARYIADARELPLEFDERLMEMDFGAWEGQPWSGIPMSEIDAWDEDFMHARPHGGESVAMFTSRVEAALADWSAHRETIAVVTHAGAIKVACSRFDELPRSFEASIGFGGIIALPDAKEQPTARPNHD